MQLSQNLIPPVAYLKIQMSRIGKSLTCNKHVGFKALCNKQVGLKVIILSFILELPMSERGAGPRTQPIRKLLNDLLITSALNPTILTPSNFKDENIF
jgi:hypothetical protein